MILIFENGGVIDRPRYLCKGVDKATAQGADAAGFGGIFKVGSFHKSLVLISCQNQRSQTRLIFAFSTLNACDFRSPPCRLAEPAALAVTPSAA